MNEREALAICFANLRGRHKKDVLATARALNFLQSLPKYGSRQKVSEVVPVGEEMVREFLSVLDLPIAIQQIIEEKQFNLEKARRLRQLQRWRPEVLKKTASGMKDLTAHDSRHLVDFLLKHPESTVASAKEAVLSAKSLREREYHVIALLPEVSYEQLRRKAKQSGVDVNTLVTTIVQQWLDSES